MASYGREQDFDSSACSAAAQLETENLGSRGIK